jgi:hypothetical protein
VAQAQAGSPRMIFYLGTHEAHWLGRASFPLFVSHMRLRQRKTLPRAACRWALDSGGFTQLSQHGNWTFTPRQYAASAHRYAGEIGHLDFAAPMDWMCEPFILARTGRTVTEHQIESVNSYLELRMLDDTLPWIPVLQGWQPDDYLRCADLYAAAGIDLAAQPRVGIGSVCRRQDTALGDWIIRSLAPLRLHGFGIKTGGLLRSGHRLASADSMAWSYNARRHPPLPGCAHKSCANCPAWAARWRQRALIRLAAADAAGRQGDLFDPDEDWRQPA